MTMAEMLFADDAALCANSEEELQIIVTTFYETFKEFALQLAIKKLKLWCKKQLLMNQDMILQYTLKDNLWKSFKIQIPWRTPF